MKLYKSKIFVTIGIIFLLSSSTYISAVSANEQSTVPSNIGFDKGPSYKPVVPMKKVTMVNFDENSYLDDYNYLAAVPTAIFDDGDKLYSNPLLFYQDEYPVKEDKEKSLNARQGIDYFMDDWMSYCNGRADQMTLINVPQNKLDSSWKAKEYNVIKSDDPYELASKLALSEWSYSDDAVIAVIGKDSPKTDYITPIVENGTLSSGKEIVEHTFYTKELSKIAPRNHFFEVPEGYKYLKSRTWWPSFWVGTPAQGGLPININITIPGGSPDSQFYCKHDDQWMEVALSQGWNIGGMDQEKAEAYIYNPGEWRLSITDIPTFKIAGKTGSLLGILENLAKGTTYQTDITLYPGEDLKTEQPITPPFGCRDATFKLKYDEPNVNLGFSLIGPSGEEVLSAYDESAKGEVEMHLDQLGECPDGTSYSIAVFSMNELSKDVDYKLEYTWRQNITKTQGDFLTSATNGAVLASTLNAPLLYVSPSSITDSTKETLYKLGVENVYLVNLGNHLSTDVKEQIKDIAKINKNYVDATKLYKAITDITNQNCIIFSTIDPWTYWYVPKPKPVGETKAGLFIGPAAYIAAHHGSPVLIVDYHEELSSAVVWHNEFWKRHGNGLTDPSIAPMYLTGRQVYDFLDKIGLDKSGPETMITVADGFDIGATWDRMFAGKAKPGRFFGSPVDTAYWISRNIFYPALIFNNPAMNPSGVELTQGSYSERRTIFPWGKFGLKITKESQDENFKYPVLQTYICYEHNLNKAFETYYGFKYQTPDGMIPGETITGEPIDEGIMPGVAGSVLPDMSSSEVVPAYLTKGGYSNVFSTSYEAITDNLNGGALLWVSTTHGISAHSGALLTWDPANSPYGSLLKGKLLAYQKQKNPWRGYDWYLGSTENPDTMTMEAHGILAALLGDPNINGLFPLTEDIWPSERPILHGIFGLLNKIPILKLFIPEWLASSDYYKDGMVIAHTMTISSTTINLMTGWNLDETLDNIHSTGWINTACLPAYKYLHLAMMRHGSAFQVIDPWPTSWYSVVWQQGMPRDMILGDTVGEAYTKGIGHVGILYLGGSGGVDDKPQWWWDLEENVCLFGDPDLRSFVPGTEYSDNNHWEKDDVQPIRYDKELTINGHMPFGATDYPNEKEPLTFLQQYLVPIIAIAIIVLLVIVAIYLPEKKKIK